MEKKVRYLMLLLCFYLFPFQVFALESEVETEGQGNVVVVDNNKSNEIEEQEEQQDNTVEPIDLEIDQNQNEGEKEGDNSQTQPISNSEETTLETISEIELIFNNDLVITLDSSEYPDAEIPEESNYELWAGGHYWIDSEDIVATDPIPGETYRYKVVVRPKEEFQFEGTTIPVKVGEQYYIGTLEDIDSDGWYTYVTNIEMTAPNEIIKLEDIEITNDVKKAYIGHQPYYSATTSNEHVHVLVESWEYYEDVVKNINGEEMTFESWPFINTTDYNHYIEIVYDCFDTFEQKEGRTYSHVIYLSTDKGYELNLTKGDKINGYVVDVYQEDGIDCYKLVQENVVPVKLENEYLTTPEEVTVWQDEITDTSVTVDEEFTTEDLLAVYDNGKLVEATDENDEANYVVAAENKTVTFTEKFLKVLQTGYHELALLFKEGMSFFSFNINYRETTTTNTETTSSEPVYYYTTYERVAEEETEDNELEVKEDKEEKEDKEKETEKSNVGLIIFLIILIIIAIAIPLTVYKKKQ